jgi:hypothetical protein
VLRLLEGMDNLSDLRIRIGHPRRHRHPVAPFEEIIPAAESILRTSKAPRQKELRIQHLEGAASDSDDIIREERVFVVGGSQWMLMCFARHYSSAIHSHTLIRSRGEV